MTERTPEQLMQIRDAITLTMRETGAEFGLSNAELASVMILVATDLGFEAWGPGVSEQLRNAADIFERHVEPADGPTRH